MATAREMKERTYAEEIYNVLEGFKMKLMILREELSRTYGKESKVFAEHDRHLISMIEYIDWKIEVLEKGTPFDWKAAKGLRPEIISDVSVRVESAAARPEVSSGYLGG